MLAKWALMCYSSATHERLLSESSRSYMLGYKHSMSVFVLLYCIQKKIKILGTLLIISKLEGKTDNSKSVK
jgi:hypothetical protein